MKRFFFNLIKIALSVLVVLIVLLAIISSIARNFFSSIERYHAQIEHIAEEFIHQPVQIGTINAHWRGISPVFTFSHVVIFNSAKTVPVIQVREINLSPNLFASLLHWRFEPGLIRVEGTYLRIQQLNDGNYNINGIATNFKHQAKPGDLNDLVDLLLEQEKISLSDIDIDWYGRNNLKLPIRNLHFKLSQGFFHHRIIGGANLAQAIPTALNFQINLHGNVINNSDASADFHIYLKNIDLSQWLSNFNWHNIRLTRGKLDDIEIRGTWSNYHLQSLQSVFKASGLNFQSLISLPTPTSPSFNFHLPQPLVIDDLSAEILWQRNLDGWSLNGQNVVLKLNEQIWPINHFNFQYVQAEDPSNSSQLLKLNSLDISQSTQLLALTHLLPPALLKVLTTIHPQGELQNISLQHRGNDYQDRQYQAELAYSGVNFLAWENFPGMENLSGKLTITANSGTLKLNGKQLTVNLPRLFNKPLFLDSYAGTINWQKKDSGWAIKSDNFKAQVLNNNLQIQFVLDLPDNHSSPIINMSAELNGEGVQQLTAFIPTEILHPKLANWLEQAFIKGGEINSTLELQGPLADFPFDDNSGKFHLAVKAKNIDFNYKNDWPIIRGISANLVFDKHSLTINTQGGQILNVPIKSANAIIPDLHTPILTVQGKVNTDLSNGLNFIHNSPLQKIIGGALQPIQLQGPMQLNLRLAIPLSPDKDEIELNGDINILPGSTLLIPEWQTTLNQLQGSLNFTQDTLSSNSLNAKLLNFPVSINIATANALNQHIINFNMAGHISIAALQQQYHLPLFNFLQGETDYQAVLSVIRLNNTENMTFNINSNLSGIAVNFPAPFSKLASDITPFALQISPINPNKTNVQVNYNNVLSVALTYLNNQNKWELFNGDLRLGGDQAVFQSEPGILIDGHLKELSWDLLQPYLNLFFDKQSQNTAGNAFSIKDKLRLIALTFDKINMFGMTFPESKLSIQPKNLAWLVQVNNAKMSGYFQLPSDYPHQPIEANFNYLYLDSSESTSPQIIKPSEIPPLNLVCHDFQYGNRHFDQLTLDIVPHGQILFIKQLKLDSPILALIAAGQWEEINNYQKTTLTGRLNSTNMGNVLKNWNATSSMVGGKGNANFTLSWLGPAYAPNLNILNGNISMQFNNGRIINIGKSAENEVGLGRVLNLLSLQTLPRRLTFNFSDLTKKGFSFDIMKGNFLIQNGNATTSSAYLDGPIAKVELNGRIGLAAKDYNLQMVITPYVTSSLPVIAAIAGGPIAGVVAWFANNFVGKAVSRISTHTYHVTGSWDNPDVEDVNSFTSKNYPMVSGN